MLRLDIEMFELFNIFNDIFHSAPVIDFGKISYRKSLVTNLITIFWILPTSNA